MVPLSAVFAQQPVIATVRPILLEHLDEPGQQEIVSALDGANEIYKTDILKLFVSLIEQSGSEVSPDIWEIYYELKHPAKIRELQESIGQSQRVSYELPNKKSVFINESRNTLVEGGETGHRTWESSLALTEYICANQAQFDKLFTNNTVVELGAGTGLVSLAVAQLFPQAKDIIATDGSPAIVQRLQNTIEQNASTENDLQVRIHTEVVDWSDEEAVQALPKQAAILAGDILYGLESMYPTILHMLETLAPQAIFFCNPIRNVEGYERFKVQCTEHGYGMKVLHTWPAASVNDSEYMFIVSVPPIPVELIEIIPKKA